MRSALEAVDELGLTRRTIAVFGIGCYTAFSNNLDVEVLQALHGRAPSVATGVKRARPDTVVFTVQGDGDMVSEGLQEVLHTAARGENVTCIMLNNGVFGETGGHMTATTVARPADQDQPGGARPGLHGRPILLGLAAGPGRRRRLRGPRRRSTPPATWPGPRRCCCGPSRPRWRGAGSPSWRSSPCARPAGSSRPRRRPAYLEDNLAAVHAPGRAEGRRSDR